MPHIDFNSMPPVKVEAKKTSIDLIESAISFKKLSRGRNVAVLLINVIGVPFVLAGKIIQVPIEILALIGLPFQQHKRAHACFYLAKAFLLNPLNILWTLAARVMKVFVSIVGIFHLKAGAKLYIKVLQFENIKLKIDQAIWNVRFGAPKNSKTVEIDPDDATTYLGTDVCQELNLSTKGLDIYLAKNAVKLFMEYLFSEFGEHWTFDKTDKTLQIINGLEANEEIKAKLLQQYKKNFLNEIDSLSVSDLKNKLNVLNDHFKKTAHDYFANIFDKYHQAVIETFPEINGPLELVSDKRLSFLIVHQKVLEKFKDEAEYEEFLKKHDFKNPKYWELLDASVNCVSNLLSYKKIEVKV